ncbi:hypothetical protein KY284_032689 [Solanum tuberosum]|nr:hypothetical protein KY284_032689 [Solanum tuberosum]
MGRGRPRRATQRLREEEISHGIASSTTSAQTTRRVATDEEQLQTPDGPPQIPMTTASKEKGKQYNGTVTQGKPNNTQRKLELNGEDGKKLWANLFATNRLATRGMNLNYIPLVIVDGEKVVEILPEDVAQDDEKWAPSIVVYMVGTTPSIEAMERLRNLGVKRQDTTITPEN